MAYFDIFVAPVPSDTKDTYSEFCRNMQSYFLGLGATEAVDFWGDDVPDGELTSLPMAVKLKENETVAAGYVIWPDKQTRDAGWAKMMSEDEEMDMPMDGKRMIFGGFSEIAVTRA